MFRLGILTAAAGCLSGCSDGCGNDVVSRAVAPDGLHSALIFQRDCGATTGFSTQISVLAAGEEPSGSGNAFVADEGQGAVRGGWGGPWAATKWVDGRTLLIRYASGSHVYEQSRQVKGVTITYEVAH